MKSRTVSGTIIFKDELNIQYAICRIDQTVFENDDYSYVFTPDYEVIDILPPSFEGIPGLDLELREEQYVRENITPVFIAERVPPKNRENLQQELEKVGLDYYDPLEWLIRTNTQYFGDTLFVEKYRIPVVEPYILSESPSTAFDKSVEVMEAIASGRKIILHGEEIPIVQKKFLSDFIRLLMKSESDRKKGYMNLRGRKPVEVDPFELNEICTMISKGEMTLDRGALKLGVSRATMYRRMKEFGLKIN